MQHLGRSAIGRLLLPARRLCYPSQPLSEPIEGFSAVLSQSSQPQSAVRVRQTAETKVTRLENGLRVASQEGFGQYSTVGVFIDAGPRYEVKYTSGISHFLQKLAFNSTSKFESKEQLLSELEQWGGVADCQKFRDLMMYSLSVFSSAVPKALEALGEVVWRPQLKEEEVEMERNGIRFELEELKNGPNAEPFMMELIHQAAYRGNTLGLPSICSEDAIDQVSAKQLRKFLASHYLPSRMVLTGVNVDHDSFVGLAKEHFVVPEPSWVCAGVEPGPIDESIAQYTSGIVSVPRIGPPVVGPNPLPDLVHVAMALESSSFLDPDFFPLAVLNSLMGGGGSFSAGGPGKGMYTQLYLNVLNRHHWVYSMLAQNHAYVDSGIFVLLGSTHPSNAKKLTEVMCQQFYEMTFAPKESDLQRAKKQLQSAMMMNLESRLIVFEDIGRQFLGQNMKYTPREICEKIDAVTGKDLERVGQRMMESNPSMAALGDLKHLPTLSDVMAAFNNKGHFPTSSGKLFSFR